VEPVIGHLKEDHRIGRNYLVGQAGDAVLAAVGYNFGLLLAWLAGLRWLLCTLVRSAGTAAPNACCATDQITS
jgi:IS5 family transposase